MIVLKFNERRFVEPDTILLTNYYEVFQKNCFVEHSFQWVSVQDSIVMNSSFKATGMTSFLQYIHYDAYCNHTIINRIEQNNNDCIYITLIRHHRNASASKHNNDIIQVVQGTYSSHLLRLNHNVQRL